MKIRIILLLPLFFFLNSSFISPPMEADWNLVTKKGDLSVYKRDKPGSKFKEVKILNILNASMKDAIDEYNDIEAYPHWVYKCSQSYTVKTISDTESITYGLSDLPIPFWDRDLVTYCKYSYDEKTKVHRYDSYVPENDEEYVPIADKVVRMKNYKSSLTLESIGGNRVRTINIMHVDPGGSIPAWLNNKAISRGPINTMRALQERLD